MVGRLPLAERGFGNAQIKGRGRWLRAQSAQPGPSMTIPFFISRVCRSVAPMTWRPIARAWAMVAVIVATLVAGPALAVTKTVNGISLDINMPQAQRGVQYSYQLSPSGRTAPYTFTILSGALPAAFTMSSSGLVTGSIASAPTAATTWRCG
jgi:hypothetical protein